MQVIFIRHGDAGAYTQPDHARQLSPLGKQQASLTGKWLAQHYTPTHFIVSPYTRAKQTLAIIEANLAQQLPDMPLPKTTVYEHITPNDDAKTAIAGLAKLIDGLSEQAAQCVVVVCHMNIIAHITALLTDTQPEGFSLAEARVLDFAGFATGFGTEQARFVPHVEPKSPNDASHDE